MPRENSEDTLAPVMAVFTSFFLGGDPFIPDPYPRTNNDSDKLLVIGSFGELPPFSLAELPKGNWLLAEVNSDRRATFLKNRTAIVPVETDEPISLFTASQAY